VRVPDGHDELADAQGAGVAESGGGEVARVRAQHGEVRERVGAQQPEAQVAAVDERGRALAGAVDDVGRRQEMAVGRDDDGAAGAEGCAAAAQAARHPQVGDARREIAGHGRDDARVGIERLAVVRRRWAGLLSRPAPCRVATLEEEGAGHGPTLATRRRRPGARAWAGGPSVARRRGRPPP
jgi:hypothetical protein